MRGPAPTEATHTCTVYALFYYAKIVKAFNLELISLWSESEQRWWIPGTQPWHTLKEITNDGPAQA